LLFVMKRNPKLDQADDVNVLDTALPRLRCRGVRALPANDAWPSGGAPASHAAAA
jgi:hypothetical protein